MSLTPRGTAGSDAAGLVQEPGQSAGFRYFLTCGAGFLFVLFVALGTWQVQRLHWKLDLIARVNQRVHAAPAAPPGPSDWPQVTAASDEYRHVVLSGNFLYEFTTRVQATSELGSGFWLMTPLCGSDGNITLINRGFVPAKAQDYAPAAAGAKASTAPCVAGASAAATVTGLLRISEPGGGFLRSNDPAGNRWYSRDVAAIATWRAMQHVAPYFVDVDASQPAAEQVGPGDDGQRPVGGLTVIAFHNSHLVYAFTWYTLAIMVLGAFWWVRRK